MPEIKYVCFDIGGVANVRPLSYIIHSAVEKKWNLSEEDWRKMVQPKLDGRDVWREFNNGKIDADQYVSDAFRSVNIPATIENMIFFYRLLQEWCGVPYQGTLDVIDALKKNGYHTSVLSNNNEIMYNTFSAEAIKKRVDVAISSHEIGFSKPSIPAYLHLLDAIGGTHLRHDLVFVDDREKNVEMANKLGINGFHFRSKEEGMDKALGEFVTYLREKGVRI